VGRIAPRLQELITFRRINLVAEPWPIRTRFDVIFLRNVVIYFDRPTKDRLFERMAATLNEDGLLIVGHAESLIAPGNELRFLGRTIYQKNASSDRLSGATG
jgi:chemotaxis protein methyltransferase CheR